MKVSTDACLFGAVTDLSQSQNLLDIGTGTGLLALMSAQRCEAQITGVELDHKAAEQARNNFKISPWSDRLFLSQQAIQDFASISELRFDTIICNPPFFSNHQPSQEARRHIARHNDNLSFYDLGESVTKLLTSQGSFQVLIPTTELVRFRGAMEQQQLYLNKNISIRPSTTKAANRQVLTFSRKEGAIKEEEICIRAGSDYSHAFIERLQPFYLKL